SRADLEDLQARGFVEEGRAVHLPNAVDLERFRPGDPAAARARLGLAGGGPWVGTVARLVRQKGVADLVRAMAGCPGGGRVVAGGGPLAGELKSLAGGLGVEARFLGPRDDVPAVLQALDLFVLPSLWEGEPIALLEAMAAGLPSVATRTSGAGEVL